jgi:hypothetical protein
MTLNPYSIGPYPQAYPSASPSHRIGTDYLQLKPGAAVHQSMHLNFDDPASA